MQIIPPPMARYVTCFAKLSTVDDDHHATRRKFLRSAGFRVDPKVRAYPGTRPRPRRVTKRSAGPHHTQLVTRLPA
jgi:hypothetical protein